MQLHELNAGYKRKPKSRVGRGIAAGQGKTAGRGTKGQKSRSGYNLPRKFEGGQSSLWIRLPKISRLKRHQVVNQTIDRALINKHFKDGDIVSPQTLLEKGLIHNNVAPVKILGSTAVTVKVSFEDVKQSVQK